MGADYVCTCCHRMMYKQNVVPYKKSKYTKASNELLDQVLCAEHNYISNDGNQWLCCACDSALSRGNMPVQAKANNLQVDEVPIQLSTLNSLELRLISLRVPFMKMVALLSGKQRSIQGPAVNVPSKLDSICTMLPRLPTQLELIALKLKRKLKYKGHYMYDYVSPEKIMNALEWLKENNPLYADVNVNEHWVDESQANDGDLFQGLVRQPKTNILDDVPSKTLQQDTLEDSTNHNEPMECEPGLTHGHNACVLNGSANHIVAAWDRLTRLARENGFTVHDVPGDGNCLFNAVAYQLDSVSANEMREIVANHLKNNALFYRDFLAQPIQCSNAYSADTEAPSSEDEIIDSVHDYENHYPL